MATSRPPKSGQSKPRNNTVRTTVRTTDKNKEKRQIKEDLKNRIEIELYKLTQDVIIQRMGVRDELFGDNENLDNLRKSMEKHEEEKLKKDQEQKKENKKTRKPNNRPKMDIKLKLIKRED